MPLILHRHLGENRLLVEGGLLDQPVGLWFAVQYAGWVDSFLEKISKPDFDWFKANLGKAEYDLGTQIKEIRERLRKDHV